jgi:hypothetical protein
MSYLLDLIGSVILAGFVIITGLQFSAALSANADAQQATVSVQETTVDLLRSLEYDFRKIGYGVPDGQQVIIDTGATRIKFLSDINRNGTVDSVMWYVGARPGTFPNPNIIGLYRKVNTGSPVAVAIGVTQFNLRYLDTGGGAPASMSAIATIEITLKLESANKIQDQVITDQSYDQMGYATVFWRQTRLSSRNIRRHG